MSDALSLAVNGIRAAVARMTQATDSVVNASSTSKNLDANLISLAVEKTNIASDAFVIASLHKRNQRLLDMVV